MTNENVEYTNVGELPPEILAGGIFLVLLNVKAMPPHILLMVDKKIYSITVKDKKIAEPAEPLLKKIRIKKTATLFFKIAEGAFAQPEKLLEEIISRSMTVSPENSCLAPVRQFFSHKTGAALSARTIFELLPVLQAHNLMKSVYHLNMEGDLIDNNIRLRTYSYDAVRLRINQLKNDLQPLFN